ncbi:MAG: hypothetical protein UX39_C0013G0024 [Candidatus Magasanikbacteria bacterium GW2011_GWA2_46_17]|uniref:Uncharacterized protein n=1 Tax=Candidatus Magasanikbacteria bacterium GW2011_GWA2_46_17 TaxID=1619042 RepID=A0A0G1P0B9_9BACT|nr:MAG: hypothetical protein UX39_C0013G0024 [Candidatus Magasanikbacteria bacterium GW2011_GWA2_46_17]
MTKEQNELLWFLKKFGKEYGLVGGTAIALHIGHRRSIDFDLFTEKEFDGKLLERKARRIVKIDKILKNKESEFTFFTQKVKITFFSYPFSIDYKENFDNIIKMPDLLTLSAMKAFALGQRAKWKDYVDLYFVMKDFFTFQKISRAGKKIFGSEFNEKLFRLQLSYFDDVSYEEEVKFLPGFEVSDKTIKKELIEFSLG